jgi:hypothetical protein
MFQKGVSTMSLPIKVRDLVFCCIGFSTLLYLGCKSADGEGAGQTGVSAPVKVNTEFATRDPRQCTGFTAQPSVAAATILIQCTMDGKSSGYINLIQNVTVQLAGPRAFIYTSDSFLNEIDTKAPVIPLRGSLTAYGCSTANTVTVAGKNCESYEIPAGTGRCWKTTFGDWKCTMGGANANARRAIAGPTAF